MGLGESVGLGLACGVGESEGEGEGEGSGEGSGLGELETGDGVGAGCDDGAACGDGAACDCDVGEGDVTGRGHGFGLAMTGISWCWTVFGDGSVPRSDGWMGRKFAGVVMVGSGRTRRIVAAIATGKGLVGPSSPGRGPNFRSPLPTERDVAPDARIGKASLRPSI